MARRCGIDWETIETCYRLGILTLRQIAEKHNVSHSQISIRAKKFGWSRDLSEEVRATAKAKILRKSREQAEKDFRDSVLESSQESIQLEVAKTFDAIEAGAEALATVELKQRGRLAHLNEMFQRLMGKLDVVVGDADTLCALADRRNSDDPDVTKELYKLTSLPVMMDMAKKAVELNSKLQSDERLAFGMDVTGAGDNKSSIEEAILKIEAFQATKKPLSKGPSEPICAIERPNRD